MTQQSNPKGIDCGWPVSHRFPPACIFLVYFHWKQTSFFAIFEWNPQCTTGSNQMISGNTVSVATLIEEIQSELKNQTGSWRKVTELLKQADVEFGFGTDEMKQIPGQTDISKSKASKLISIAQDDIQLGSFTQKFCEFKALDLPRWPFGELCKKMNDVRGLKCA